MSLYLIAYDIADPRRLKRVARHLEQHAQRRQKSVFMTDVTEARLNAILDGAAELMSESEDVLQAWKIAADQPPDGIGRGAVVPSRPDCVVYGPGLARFVLRS